MTSIKDKVKEQLTNKTAPKYDTVVSVRLPVKLLKAVDDIKDTTKTKRSEVIVALLAEALNVKLK